ncbi:MAG TPA: glucodextranase DOMON-like domain-containing protein [Bacillota bacterium]|nr:glucodextranase DOMON-like domain-containing protein [Bacillota bacterium]
MIRKSTFIYICLWCLAGFCLLGAAAAYPVVYFQMSDPVADEYGYGTYQYPGNIAFKPYKGLFDITGFKVWSERTGEVCFDTTFGTVTNPWAAPEGFIHQNLRIFIDSQPQRGFTTLPQPGAGVRFNPKNGWDLGLKVVGWENSQLFTAEGNRVKMWPLKAELLGDGSTIRVKVATSQIGIPAPTWNYYVMVGSYDGFGEDFFRKVNQKRGEWVIGGGLDQALEPQVLDILAPATGPRSQVAQLSSFNRETGALAELSPVGLAQNAPNWWIWVGGLLIAGSGLIWLLSKSNKISWFWVPKVKKAEAK